jgi:hypothetical protein
MGGGGMTSEPELNTKVIQSEIDWIVERVPHVVAWCYRADGLLLPVGIARAECSSLSCHDYRVLAAGRLYEAGIRPPVRVGQYLKEITTAVAVVD